MFGTAACTSTPSKEAKAARNNPHLYETNARVFLGRLLRKYGPKLTLATVPDEEWKAIRSRGFDLVWLMGVWQRSPAARRQALGDPGRCREYDDALPGWNEGDIDGSPYAVYAYSLDHALGAEKDLAEVRSRLNRNGLGLVLDFVPNHLAVDSPWVSEYPRRFVQADEDFLAKHPDWFFSPDGGKTHLAHGKDPFFPPWTDTAQLNYFSEELRQAMARELVRIADVSDGVRCDMAMLVLNSVFERDWGSAVAHEVIPMSEFWVDAISTVKNKWPGYIFLAEAYWELEMELRQTGFDFTYDKDLYDRLRYSDVAAIRRQLASDPDQSRTVHFVENHDEPRAAAVFGRERSMAAAVVQATVPGLRLYFDGQLEGSRIHPPVRLVRWPEEPPDSDIIRFYERLLAISNDPAFHQGSWAMLNATEAWPGNQSHSNMLAWCWRSPKGLMIVVVNYSSVQSQCRLRLPMELEHVSSVTLHDEMGGDTYQRDAGELRSQGFYVDLAPWHAHILRVVRFLTYAGVLR